MKSLRRSTMAFLFLTSLAGAMGAQAQGTQPAVVPECLDPSVPRELLTEVDQAMQTLRQRYAVPERRLRVLEEAFRMWTRPGGSVYGPAVLRVFRYAGAEALPFLSDKLLAEGQSIRRAAAMLLRAMEDRTEDPSVQVREIAPEEEMTALLPLLIRTTYDTDAAVRSYVEAQIGTFIAFNGADTPPRVVDAFCRLLDDPEYDVREGAAWGLRKLGRDDLIPPALRERMGTTLGPER